MSSFDKTGGKNLDEILASIRKTLADESTPPDAAQPFVQANSGASPLGNGGPAAAAKIDDDFADLLAGGLGTAPLASPGTEATDAAPADQKDPLWFLRPSGGREPQVLPLPPDRSLPSLDGLVDGGVPPPQRSSFTTQFIADSHGGDVQAAASSPALPAEAPSPALAAEPRTIFKSKPGNGLSPEAMGPGSANGSDAADVAPPPAASASEPAAAAKPPVGSPARTEAEAKSPAAGTADGAPSGGVPREGTANAGSAGSASPVARPEAVPAKPDAGQQQAAASRNPAPPADAGKPAAAPAAATPSRFGPGMAGPSVSKTASPAARASGLNGAAVVGASAAPTPAGAKAMPTSQTQAIEQIIEQLLEPLLRRWVEANLPRLVEAAIRAEVARTLEKKTASGPEAERKL